MTYRIQDTRTGKYEGARADLPAALERAREVCRQTHHIIAVYDDEADESDPPVALVFADCVYTRVDESQ